MPSSMARTSVMWTPPYLRCWDQIGPDHEPALRSAWGHSRRRFSQLRQLPPETGRTWLVGWDSRPMPPQDRRRFNDPSHTEQAQPQHAHQQRGIPIQSRLIPIRRRGNAHPLRLATLRTADLHPERGRPIKDNPAKAVDSSVRVRTPIISGPDAQICSAAALETGDRVFICIASPPKR